MITPVFDRLIPLLPHAWRRHREEFERITRFIIIGGLSFIFNYALYIAISRWLWKQGDRTLENFLATSITCVANYLAHRAWTFRSGGSHGTQAVRYVMVALSAVALQSFFFWIGYHILGGHDLVVIFVVAILIPFYTYLAHKLFTFRSSHVIS